MVITQSSPAGQGLSRIRRTRETWATQSWELRAKLGAFHCIQILRAGSNSATPSVTLSAELSYAPSECAGRAGQRGLTGVGLQGCLSVSTGRQLAAGALRRACFRTTVQTARHWEGAGEKKGYLCPVPRSPRARPVYQCLLSTGMVAP